MTDTDYLSLLGLHFDEGALREFLNAAKITKTPKIPRDDVSTCLEIQTLGIEMTFTDVSYFSHARRFYPDGALVLTSIHFHGTKTRDHEIFPFSPPKNLVFGMHPNDVNPLLGDPQLKNENTGLSRWNFDDKWIAAFFNEANALIRVTVQFQSK